MENNTNRTIIILVGVAALLLGYLLGSTIQANDDSCSMDMMHEGVGDMMGSSMHVEEEVSHADGAMQHSMEEMMRGLRGKEGAAFEEAFLEGMIVHHEGAIEMAEQLKLQTNRPELLKMANDIVVAQTREVTMMQGWLAAWF